MLRQIALGIVVLGLVSPVVAAPRDPQWESQLLADRVCELRSVVEATTQDPFARRVVCQFESAVELLRDKLACPHDIEPIRCAMRDTQLAAERTIIVLRRSCTAADHAALGQVLDCTLRQLTRTQLSVDLLIAAGGRVNPLGGIPAIPQVSHFGHAGSLGPMHANALHHGAARIDPRDLRNGGFDRGFPSRAPGAWGEQIGTPPWNVRRDQVVRNQQARGIGTVPRSGMPFESQLQSPWGLNRSGLPQRPPAAPNGEIGRAILGMLLSEFAR